MIPVSGILFLQIVSFTSVDCFFMSLSRDVKLNFVTSCKQVT